MKILIVSDEESSALWDYYVPGRLREYDLIISCGDLKAKYLSFLVTMARCPLVYVHGNHDTDYVKEPPDGCDCIEDQIIVYNGIRILGLGGCRKYNGKHHQYTEAQMRRRINRLRWKLWRTKGVDIVVTHAPPEDLGDAEDPAHWGFRALRELLDQYHPKYLVHGHVHQSYGQSTVRELEYKGSRIINACGRYVLEIPEGIFPERQRGQIIWKTRYKDPYPQDLNDKR